MAVETIIQPLIDPIFLVLSIIFIVFLITKRKGFDQAYEQVIKQRDFTNKMVIDFVVKTLFWLIRLAIFVCAFMTELFTVNPFALKDIHEKQLIQITKPLGKPYKISRKYGSANYSRYKYHNVNADMLSLTQKTIELQGDWIKVAKKDMDYPNETFAQYCNREMTLSLLIRDNDLEVHTEWGRYTYCHKAFGSPRFIPSKD